ncbi:unnamed protein product [Pleuronectes platessa]|uniref:Cadherin domain-containing protein n=1 Tax=Pleuronectes platessa TaxID=8262 RepID=A0A9N7YBD1_PLEPL|nr:unnamed protein product [Pleuronectes platessa]
MSGNHIFRLTGPGADQDPRGLFIIDIDTGDVSVSRSLDREAIDSYQAVTSTTNCLEGSGRVEQGQRSISALAFEALPLQGETRTRGTL